MTDLPSTFRCAARRTRGTPPETAPATGRWARSRGRGAQLLLLAVLLSACGTTEPLEDRRVGVISEVDGQPDVTVPTTARAAEGFEVRIVTEGGGCIRKDDTELTQDQGVATVTPWDRYGIPRPGLVCLALEETIEHIAVVTFDAPGEAQVVVRGRLDGSDEIRDLTYTLMVEP